MSTHIDSLHFFMQEQMLPCSISIKLDGKIHRYCRNGGREPDEWYIGRTFDNGHILCTFSSWSQKQKHIFKSWEKGEAPPDYHADIFDNQTEQAIKLEQTEAATRAKNIWDAAEACLEHSYIKNKKVKSFGLKVYHGDLIIPIYDLEGNLSSLQKIRSDGSKKFLFQGKIAACFFIIGDLKNSPSAYVCEGYATGASIHEATGKPVVVAFSAGQLIPVTFILKEKYSHINFYNAADLGKVGEETAQEWEKIIKTPTYFPKLPQEDIAEGLKDFNDLHQKYGLGKVADQLTPKQYPVISITEFLNKSISPLSYIIENLFIEGSTNLLYAESGIGKSIFAYDLAYCLAWGRRFIKWPINVSKRVLYIDGEMTEREIKSHFTKIAVKYPDPPTYIDKNLSIVTSEMITEDKQKPVNLFNSESRHKLSETIKNYDLIILDNLKYLTESDEINHENKMESWQPVHRWLQEWCSKNKTFLILHHSNNSGGSRGSSSIRNDPRTIIKLTEPTTLIESLNLAFDVHIEKGRHMEVTHKLSFTAEWALPDTPYSSPWNVYPIIKKKTGK